MQEFLVTAVDIGTKKISASCGISAIGQEVEILGSSCVYSEGVENGQIVDIDRCRERFLEVLDKLEKNINREIKEIYIGISSSNVELKEENCEVDIDGEVTPKHINEVKRKLKQEISLNEDEEICDIVINYYKVDDKKSFDLSEKLSGNKLIVNATVIVCKKDIIKRYIDLCIGTRYEIKGFVVNIMSLKKIFLFKEQLGNRVLIESGASSTEVAVLEDGIVKELFFIPLGGNNITNDLTICADISNEIAEKIKCNYSETYKSICNQTDGESISFEGNKINKELFYKVCEARIEEILKYVKNKLKNTSNYKDFCSIILCSDSLTNFENIEELSNRIIGENMHIITKNEFNMQNFSNITSLAIVKEVHDRVELIYEDFTKEVKDNTLRFENLNDINRKHECKLDNTSHEIEKKNKGIIGKLRSLLEDIF
ncbi:cell division FtsA domain-containing protein [Eubacterium multiforme]|uniref:Cell division protein FtsA n=1 Tax=Eubacterium multiforme TaxID=83339 RepID=A0ABT9UR12_9FIRM|nr:cell division FtsA domain-containing protein [Eubacterium multiforme]MDQ0148095.1 cell division protein FtsA [Eubacterium multiforme]